MNSNSRFEFLTKFKLSKSANSNCQKQIGVPVLALSRTLKSTYQGGVLVYSQKYTCAVWWCKKCPLSIIFVVSAGSEASEPSRRRSPASATVAFDRPNVCRTASGGEKTPIAARARRYLSPRSAQRPPQGLGPGETFIDRETVPARTAPREVTIGAADSAPGAAGGSG